MQQRSFLLKAIAILFIFTSSHALLAQERSSLFWKVSGNGLEQDSYLYGTIHIICKDQFHVGKKALNALKDSKELLLEIDMADPEIMGKMGQISFNEGMKNINEYISESDQEKVNEFFKESFGAGLEQLGAMKPFILSSMVLTQVISCPDISSYEQFFLGKAQENKIPIVGLETIEFQVSLFDEIPMNEQVDELVKSIIDKEKGSQEFMELVSVYLTEDIKYIHDQILSSDMFANYTDALLYDRNKAWIPIIEASMEKNSVFVAVGAGHLGSENGLVQLLRKQGYNVEPVLQ
ncbi:MAG: TraB/GumN family protein [Mongoliibacter sp.]|uniref:TraB/GumN family protein n=1 Tax=Mongoliibacter sp. TaxID=2022438 RepID=UPI0012EF18AF|nr:TraB/GumN family protein [Mongoliibacter sp.]TVP51561.1 MAG: TraB/GumN family protein [Mongoliibacter sp.]